jgi:UrcA family protein
MRSLKPAVAAFSLAVTMLSPVTWCKPLDAKPELIGQIRVDLQGLDPQNPADARTLLARIEKAAYRACGGNPKFTWDYKLMPQRTVEVYELCREAAVKRAVDQIGTAQLAEIYKEERRAQTTCPQRGDKTCLWSRARTETWPDR